MKYRVSYSQELLNRALVFTLLELTWPLCVYLNEISQSRIEPLLLRIIDRARFKFLLFPLFISLPCSIFLTQSFSLTVSLALALFGPDKLPTLGKMFIEIHSTHTFPLLDGTGAGTWPTTTTTTPIHN